MRGEIICGYRLLRELGARALPSYAAIDPKPRRPDEALCVVEQLAREPGVNAEAAAGFLRDAKRLAQLHHPNVVQVRDVVVGTSTVLLVSDWVDGEVLSDIERMAAERSIPIPLAGSLRILMDLLEGLSALHELRDAKREPLRLVHAEVAPRNLVVGIDGRSVLVHPLRAPAGPVRNHAPDVVGYLAPEVLLGDQTADQRADVYGAGVLLWEALMGQRMHADGEDAGEIVMRLLGGKIDAPCAPIDAPWAAPLAQAARRAVAPDPSVRFANATEMLAELRKNVGARLAPKLAVAALVEAVAGERIRGRNEKLGTSGTIARLPSESAWTTDGEPEKGAPRTTADLVEASPPMSKDADPEATKPPPLSAIFDPSSPATPPSSSAPSTSPASSPPPSSKRRVAPSWGRVRASSPPPRPSAPSAQPSTSGAASSQRIRLSEPPTSADVVEVVELDVPLDKPSRPHQPPPVPRRDKHADAPRLPPTSVPIGLETPMTQSKTDLGPIALANTSGAPSATRTRWTIVAACAVALGAVLWMLTRGGPERSEVLQPPAAVSAASATQAPPPPSVLPAVVAPPPPPPVATAAANTPSPFDPAPADDRPAAAVRPAAAPAMERASRAGETAPQPPTAVPPATPPPPIPPPPAASSPHSKKRVYDPMGI